MSGQVRYTLAQPVGGFNDTNKQLNRCYLYSWRFGRSLIIDTRYSGLLDHFSNYFECIDKKLIHKLLLKPTIHLKLTDELLDELKNLSVYPKTAKEKNFINYNIIVDRVLQRQRDSSSMSPLTFKFSQGRSEGCLVHVSCGGGGKPKLMLLKLLTFKDAIKLEINKKLTEVGKDYNAIHVRNTDFTSNYQVYFREIIDSLDSDTLLVCSDSEKVLEYAHTFFKHLRVIAQQNPIKVADVALHRTKQKNAKIAPRFSEKRYLLNKKMFVDLISLACAKNIYAPALNHSIHIESGFTRLARRLQKKPHLIQQLISSN